MNNTQGALKKLHSMLHNVHEMSIRDELTGLYNRRFFSEQADLLLIRVTKSRSRWSMSISATSRTSTTSSHTRSAIMHCARSVISCQILLVVLI